jgi:PAS domain S-box-containing protein
MLFVYAYGLPIVNLIVFVWLFVRSPQHRLPVSIMLAGIVAGRLIFLLETAKILHSEAPPFALEYLMYAIALFGFRIFDPIPLARQTTIEQLQAGMLVLDPQGKIVSLNPAACAILESPAKRLLGRPIQDLLPASFDLAGDLWSTGPGQVEMSLESGAETRYYLLKASALKDWRGLEIGRLLLLHDVTEQKRAQAQLIEQQRALATLKEREHMARELHDSLGQVLGYAGLQVEVAAKLSRDGQGEAAATHLDRLGSVIREAHADVRKFI